MYQNVVKCSHCSLTFDQAIQLADHYVTDHPESPEASKINFARTQKRWTTE